MPLLVSVHDVSPASLAACARLRDRAGAAGVGVATLLVVPDHHGRGATARDRATVGWLRERAAAGDELALHGHVHRAVRAPRRLVDRARAAALTRGEGECLAQTAGERDAMLGPIRRHLEDAIGVPLRGFVAPAWLEPPGLAGVLRAAGFAWHETQLAVEALAPARRPRLAAPVLGFSGGHRARVAASVAYVRALTPLVSVRGRWTGQPVRIALHPCDDAAPRVRDVALATIGRMARRHAPATTAGALGLVGVR